MRREEQRQQAMLMVIGPEKRVAKEHPLRRIKQLAQRVGTTELFIWLHNRHDEEPNRWRVFAISEEGGSSVRVQPFSSVGVGVAYNW